MYRFLNSALGCTRVTSSSALFALQANPSEAFWTSSSPLTLKGKVRKILVSQSYFLENCKKIHNQNTKKSPKIFQTSENWNVPLIFRGKISSNLEKFHGFVEYNFEKV